MEVAIIYEGSLFWVQAYKGPQGQRTHRCLDCAARGASHSPSSSSSQSSSFVASGSSISSGSSSNHPSGFSASSSRISMGASSSQSSGFVAVGSEIFDLSSQSLGFLSSGLGIVLEGIKAGSKFSEDRKFVFFLSSPSINQNLQLIVRLQNSSVNVR
ncbi:hypothetical protein RIF29_40076 [Crotalaria pallida]|uniref:Uncharacterized protein n=1 Tax=Crotalaria pallida TaxID=3830 RepID=A0AAN9E373_CROPI